jgi:hypothetical protein
MKTYTNENTANQIATKLSGKHGKPFIVNAVAGGFQVVEAAAAPLPPQAEEQTPADGTISNETKIESLVEGTAGLPESAVTELLGATALTPKADSADDLFKGVIPTARLMSETVIVPEGVLGKERWFQLKRLTSAIKIATGVEVVISRKELVSRGLGGTIGQMFLAFDPNATAEEPAPEAGSEDAAEQDVAGDSQQEGEQPEGGEQSEQTEPSIISDGSGDTQQEVAAQ